MTLLEFSGETSENLDFAFYSFEYTGQSNSDVITFTVTKGWYWYLDDISVVDILTDTELIDNGDFESRTLDTYCSCWGYVTPTNNKFPEHSGLYAYAPFALSEPSKLSQSLNTIPGRKYNVSFFLNHRNSGKGPMTVYMSTGNQHSYPISCLFALLILIISFE